MNGFLVRTATSESIRFRLYQDEAPVTCAAFVQLLPFAKDFFHARLSGLEIWTNDSPSLDIIQENASVFTVPGEVVFGPLNPKRAHTANCMGIYYGEGRGLDACNIFAKVLDEDAALLTALGDSIWKKGVQQLRFEKWEE